MLMYIIGLIKTPIVYSEDEQKTFNIAAVGDVSCVSEDGKLHGNDTVSAIELHSNNLVLFLGDLSYSLVLFGVAIYVLALKPKRHLA